MKSAIGRDGAIGVVMLLLAIFYWFEANKIRISPLDGPVGASGLPKTLAYALAALSIILIVRSAISLFSAKRLTDVTIASEASETQAARIRPHLRAVGMLAIGVAYLLSVSWLGYIPAIAALLLVVALYTGAPISLRTLLIAILGSFLCYLLFVRFLGIPLPDGELIGRFLHVFD